MCIEWEFFTPVCVCVCVCAHTCAFLCYYSSRQGKDWLPPEGLWLPAACGNHGALPGYKPSVCTDKQTWRAKINYLQAHPCMLWRLGTFPALNVTIYEASAVTTYFMWLLIVTHERFAQISLKQGDEYSQHQQHHISSHVCDTASTWFLCHY